MLMMKATCSLCGEKKVCVLLAGDQSNHWVCVEDIWYTYQECKDEEPQVEGGVLKYL